MEAESWELQAEERERKRERERERSLVKIQMTDTLCYPGLIVRATAIGFARPFGVITGCKTRLCSCPASSEPRMYMLGL